MDANAQNEESMLDWEGNMKPLKEREVRVVLNKIDDSPAMVSSLHICAGEEAAIDALMMNDPKPDGNDLSGGLSFFDALSSKLWNK